MTTKKNAPALSIVVGSIVALYAFTMPERIKEQVFTVFFPTEMLATAPNRAEALAAKHAPAELQITQDTFPPLEDRYEDFINGGNQNPIDLNDPSAIDQNVEYDPETGLYIISETIGGDYFRAPTYMTYQEYLDWKAKEQERQYFDRLAGASAGNKGSGIGINDPIAKFDAKTSLVERLFGGTEVDIQPQGNINLTFGFDYQKIQNPILTLRQQRNGNFDFDMDINMNATGKIGEKLNLNFNYNTQATFDFDNQIKLKYDVKDFSEDEIIQNVEAGNVSFPLRSNLIQGASRLFGIKLETKFGHLRLTTVASQQQSRQQNLAVQGGSQVQFFETPIDQYDENRHFFLTHYNRDRFERSLSCMPNITSLFQITRMEVWVTNDQLRTEGVRDIIALSDLAEPNPFLRSLDFPGATDFDIEGNVLPTNNANELYRYISSELQMDSTIRHSDKIVNLLQNVPFSQNPQVGGMGLRQIQDFEKQRARLLSPSEYSYHDQLGFVSLNLNVQPDQVVGVAIEYQYNGEPYKIGEFSNEVPIGDSLNQNVLFLKMLKSTTANVSFPIWDLMMKNIYAVGAANVDGQEFNFDIFYDDPGKGQKRFLNVGAQYPSIDSRPLLQLFNMDNLNRQLDPGADGIFDFIPGLTINLRSGRVMFPVLEPFGGFLDTLLEQAGMDSLERINYAYNQLYDSTLFRAREFQQLNRFVLKGSYKSSTSSRISLGAFNIPRGSVRVSGGGRALVEGVDYEVDYNIGQVTILNDAILQSGQKVNVSFEDNTFFGFNQRTMIGVRADYDVDENTTVGATFMNLFERPLTQKVNFGDDPINNKMYGVDFNMTREAPWLTKLVDKLPLISTKAPSSMNLSAEIAALQPGHSRAINQGLDEGGTVYIDDFEGSTTGIPLANPANSWVISSVPREDNNPRYPEGELINSTNYGVNRSDISWFIADPSARDERDRTDPYTRIIQFDDLFPNRQLTPLEQSFLRPFDVTVFPDERGPYNFDVPGGVIDTALGKLSEGLAIDGTLNAPESRWAGIMRGIQTSNDFEAANIEFVEFWMLNPYMNRQTVDLTEEGEMFIDLGSLSEDIMRDSRQFFENALPTSAGVSSTAATAWGRVPVLPPVVNAFANDPDQRLAQDVGLDGLDDEMERTVFASWIDELKSGSTILSANALADIEADPANDNFVYYRDDRFNASVWPDPDGAGLLTRYKDFNKTQGNSPVNNTSNLNPSATNTPDMEDLNRDLSLNETESYFQYRIPMTKDASGMALDLQDPILRGLITDTVTYFKDNDLTRPYVWYRFRVPLDDANRKQIGGIQDFRSIRFVRTWFTGLKEQTTFRFATFELGRNQWRRFKQSTAYCDVPPDLPVPFDVNAVSIEEQSAREPFNYVLPNGIQREQSVGAFPDVLQNEQSLAMRVCDLGFCDSRSVFKQLDMDLRMFERIKMFVHAEDLDPNNLLEKGDASMFIRMGSDFFNNYYEYEIPLTMSDPQTVQGLAPSSREYKDEVWLPENYFDFALEQLTNAKKARNDESWELNRPYDKYKDPENPDNVIRIVGNPNLGWVKGIMVGIRNTTDTFNQKTICFESWINELRLSGFNERGGWAGIARADFKLADVGNLSGTINYSSIGWGGIDQKVIQRQLEEVRQYDLSASVELGKFLPEKVGLRLPFYTSVSNVTKRPEFDPYDLDLNLKEKLRDIADPAARDSVRDAALDVTHTKGYNFTNVRKERKKGKKVSLPWDISNFSFSYAFTETDRRNPLIISDKLQQYRGSVDYQYAPRMKPIEPFKKIIKNDTYMKWLKDFNFSPIPSSIGFSSSMERLQGITTYRFAGEDPQLNTYYNRRFTWDRNYDFNWDLARSLKFNFDAQARSIIDEPLEFTPDGQQVTRQERKDSILANIRNLGRPKNYQHNFGLNFTVPTRSIPIINWVNLRASYTGGYTWSAASLKLQNLDAGIYRGIETAENLGNVIQNNSNRQINGDLDFEKLYNKSNYLKKINKPARGKKKNTRTSSRRGASGGKEGDPGNRRGKPGETVKIGEKPQKGGKEEAATREEGKSSGEAGATGGEEKLSRKERRAAKKAEKAAEKERADKKKKDRQPTFAERALIRPLMLVRKARFTYSENYSTVVPGFVQEAKILGQTQSFSSPGWEFVAGFQPNTAWLDNLAAEGFLTHRPEFNQQVTRNYTQNLDVAGTIEPFKDFRIELSAKRQFSRNSFELFKDQNLLLDPNQVDFQHRGARDVGSLTVSYFTLNTLFNNDYNGLFQQYSENRSVVSKRLGTAVGNIDAHPTDGSDYAYGYGRIQTEVLLPAFLSAYTDSDPNTQELDIFKTNPRPNWRLTYNGLSKLKQFKKIFSSVQISHGYSNTLQMNQYNTDIFYDADQPLVIDELNFNYIARFEIPQVVISEQFQPLIGIDIKTRDGMTARVDFKKSRNLALSFVDYQLAESRSSAYAISFGHRIKDVNIPFLTGKKKKKKKKSKKKDERTPSRGGRGGRGGGSSPNDLSFKFDFEVRDDVTVNHRLDQTMDAVPTRGSRTISINPSIDYAINRQLKLRLFTDYRKTVPKTSQSFPITTLSSGVAVQFTLN